MKNKTLAAIATPPGEGGIAIIRISGKDALFVAQKIFSKKILEAPTHSMHFGSITSVEGERIDEGMACIMRAPKSYTGEDTVEISCHGGLLIQKNVLAAALSAGAEPAGPGEFTFQAFSNGKIDLAQAEAVQELIGAKNAYAMRAADQQLKGTLSKKILHWQESLSKIGAIIEAWVDFPEEGLEFAGLEDTLENLQRVLSEIKSLANTFEEGKKLALGASLCLLGAPNVGKSSLMNALLGSDRAIVTDIAGTTRDLLQEEMLLGGLHFTLTDTAGIRNTKEIIEKEGIKRSKEAAADADIILYVLDSTKGISEEEELLLSTLPQNKTLILWNKIDLASPPSTGIPISAKTEEGFADLKEAITSTLWKNGPPADDERIITKQRHHIALTHAAKYLDAAILGLQNSLSPEFIASDMRLALTSLGHIIGTDITEDLLDQVFSTFCVGK